MNTAIPSTKTSPDTLFELETVRAFEQSYPLRPCRMRHFLADHDLFRIEALQDLADSLDPALIEYNRADIDVEMDPNATPTNGLSIRDTLGSIESCSSWAVLKQVQKHPKYSALLDQCLKSIEPAVLPKTGLYQHREAFIFISSPGAVTPYHMDPEHNILMQVSGRKFMHLFPKGDDRFCSQEAHEAFHAGGHRNLQYDSSFEDGGEVYELNSGDALYVPVTAPHWVENGDKVSLSLSVTWRSRESRKESHLHKINRTVRKLGLRPPKPGRRKVRDNLLVGIYAGAKSAKPKRTKNSSE